jgi:hypothetical protein
VTVTARFQGSGGLLMMPFFLVLSVRGGMAAAAGEDIPFDIEAVPDAEPGPPPKPWDGAAPAPPGVRFDEEEPE